MFFAFYKRYHAVTATTSRASAALPHLRPRMGGPVNGAQSRGVDVGVALGRREARMSQQFLDGAQIAAGAQQVGGEGMAQGVRRHTFRQSELVTQFAHALLHDRRVERRAARAEEATAAVTVESAAVSLALPRNCSI